MTPLKPVLLISAAAIVLTATSILSGAAHPPPLATVGGDEIPLDEARIYFEYNSTDNDLGVHVFLDGEDWKKLEIENPDEDVIFKVQGTGPYADLGMTELFFEGAEPTLDDVPLQELLDEFPEGEYEFSGKTVDNQEIEGEGTLSHAIPAGPLVSVDQGPNNFLRLRWNPVTGTPPGFPNRPIHIVGYQAIVGQFQVTVPGSVLRATVTPEYVRTLAPGMHKYEVLAIEASGNQTITEGFFVK